MQRGQVVEKKQLTDVALRRYIAEITKIDLLDKEEEQKLKEKCCKEKDSHARDEILRRHLRLTVSIAHRYKNRGLPLADLIGEGVTGLITAVDKLKISKENCVATYATWWIRQALERAVIDKARCIRIEGTRIRQYIRLLKVGYALEDELKQSPTNAQIAERMEKDPQWVERLRKYVELAVISLTAISDEGEEIDLSYLAPEYRLDPEQLMIENELGIAMKSLRKLKPRHRYVLLMRLGLISELTPEEILEVIGVDIEHAAAIESSIAAKLMPPSKVLYCRKASQEWVESAKLDNLEPQEVFVFGYRFGRWHDDPISLDEIGKTLGLTHERVRQIEAGALTLLRCRVEALQQWERL